MKKQSVLIHTISDLRSAEAVIKILVNDPEFKELTLPKPIFDKINKGVRGSSPPMNWYALWFDTLQYKIIGERRPGKRTQYKPITRKIKIFQHSSSVWIKQA